MKKKTVLLGVMAVATSLSLASCGQSSIVAPSSNAGAQSSAAGANASSTAPKLTSSTSLDIHINYGKGNSGITYAQSKETTDPITGSTLKKGTLLPAWSEFQSRMSTQTGQTITFRDASAYATKDEASNYEALSGNNFKSETNTNETIDLVYFKTKQIITMGNDGKALNLRKYLDYMPNFKKYLEENPAIEEEVSYGANKAIYYTPYLDGYQQIERQYLMDSAVIAKLLDSNVPAGLGLLKSGKDGIEETVKLSSYAPFIDADYNYTADQEFDIVKDGKVAKTTVKKTENIIKQQNALLKNGCTGKELIDQFKTYLSAAYDVGPGKTYTSYTEIFTGVSAVYNADDLVALLRVVKANPDVLFGTATKATDTESGAGWREVEGLIPRGEENSRINNLIQFAGTLYGVQGMGAERDHLFFGADGCLYDSETVQASYDMLNKMSQLYSEGLIVDNFWYKSSSSADKESFKKKYIAKTAVNPSYALMMYDYSATQSTVNDYSDGLGTKTASRVGVFADTSLTTFGPVLSPITYWATKTGFDATATLGSAKDRACKTLTRYYEENRAVKDSSWCIPANSDNIEVALKLMDDMFSTEGNAIQNYGPSAYWSEGTVLGTTSPVIKQQVFDAFSKDTRDIWNYFRQVLGTTEGIGHYRPSELDYQSTNKYSKPGYDNLILATNLGVQNVSKCSKTYTWSTTVRTNCYPTLTSTITDQYKAVTSFWANDKLSSTADGWVAVVKDSKGTLLTGTVVTDGTKTYTLSEVMALFDKKNEEYLTQYAYELSPNCVPAYLNK